MSDIKYNLLTAKLAAKGVSTHAFMYLYKSPRADLAITIEWGRACITLTASIFEEHLLPVKALNMVEG